MVETPATFFSTDMIEIEAPEAASDGELAVDARPDPLLFLVHEHASLLETPVDTFLFRTLCVRLDVAQSGRTFASSAFNCVTLLSLDGATVLP